MDDARLKTALHNALDAGDVETALMIEEELDSRTTVGAPLSVRARVGNAKTQEDRLAALQRIYPNAESAGGRMIYTDEAGKRVQYNKPGFDFGDVAEFGRVIPEMVGAGIGAAVSTGGAIPTGGASLFTIPAAAGVGSEIGGQLYDMALGTPDSRGLLDRGKNALYSIAANALGGYGASKPASVADDAIRAASEIDAPLSAGQRTGSGLLNWAEDALHSSVTGGPRIAKQRENVSDAIGRYMDETTLFKPDSPTATGSMVKSGVDAWKTKADTVKTKLFDRIDDAFTRQGESITSPIDIDNLKSLRDEALQLQDAAGPYAKLARDPNIDQLIGVLDEAIESGAQPSYDLIKRYRSEIGRIMKKPQLASAGSKQGNINQIYKQASRDLEEGAEKLGGEAARTARARANKVNRNIETKLKELDPMLKGTDADVFRKTESAFYKDPGKFRQVHGSLSKPDQDALMSELLHRMSRARNSSAETGTNFSANTFTTNWRKLLKEAPENVELFTKEQMKRINNMLKVSNVLKSSTQQVNTSKTALATNMATALGGTGAGYALGGEEGAMMMAGATMGVPYLGARMLTNPAMSRAAPQALGLLGSFDDITRKLAGAGMDQGLLSQ